MFANTSVERVNVNVLPVLLFASVQSAPSAISVYRISVVPIVIFIVEFSSAHPENPKSLGSFNS